MRFTDKELSVVLKKATLSGRPIVDYCRETLLSPTAVVKAKTSPEEREYLRMLMGMANNLNQLAKRANAAGFSEVAKANKILEEMIVKLIKKLLKR